MVPQLTAKQRKTLNDAEQILKDLFQQDQESLMLSWHGAWKTGGVSTTYFTPNRVQHGSLWRADGDNTFAGKIAYALELRADEEGRADQIKAERIEKLKAELALLANEPAQEQAA